MTSVCVADRRETPTWLGKNSAELSWLDLPRTSYIDLFNASTSKIDQLHELVVDYHQLEKKDLSQRMTHLTQIIHCLQEMKAQTERNNHIDLCERIEKMAQMKYNYLSLVTKINALGTECLSVLESYHLSEEKNSIPMVNQSTYSIKMKEFWGDFWLETLDPCHRRLSPWFAEWKETISDPQNKFGDFFLWLEYRHMPKYIPTVPYLEENQRDSYRIEVKNGLLYKEENLLSAESGRWIFVISLKQVIYMANQESGLWHSSFTCGKPVAGVGVMNVKNGIIYKIKFESGHFRPDFMQAYQTLAILMQKGVTFSDPLEIQFYEDRNRYQVFISNKQWIDFIQFESTIKKQSNLKVVSQNEF